ncbi:hypothetical protein [Polaromonas sp. LjRoot131]|uniref:hypothetical protein n=1 Tax=Polaromonas sp. LjRoot131 TaxID=3342262 RepID=UPI003ECDFD38
MILLWLLILLAAVCGLLLAAAVLRRWLPRLRAEFRQLRAAARAVEAMAVERELGYQLQMAVQTPALPSPSGASPFDSGRWTVLAGKGDGRGWPADAFYKVRGLAMHRGALHASLTGPKADGPGGQVWRLSDEACTQVGGDLAGSWRADDSFVDHLFSLDDNTLLAAEKTGVWRLSDDRWTHISEGLALGEKCGPYSFASWNGQVVMGQWGHPRVALLGANNQWTYLPDPEGGWGAGARTIYGLVAFKGMLYAGTGTGRLTGPASAVWRYDGTSWEKVGGAGIRGSWAREGLPFVLSLGVFGECLVATVSRPEDTPKGASSVWLFDGDRWGPLAVGATPALMAESLIMNDAIVYKGRLVVATGHGTRRPAQIWMLDGSHGWRPVGPPELGHPGPGEGGWWVYRLCTDGERLYASTAGHRGAAKVFCFTPA